MCCHCMTHAQVLERETKRLKIIHSVVQNRSRRKTENDFQSLLYVIRVTENAHICVVGGNKKKTSENN